MSVIRSALLFAGLLPVSFNLSANCNMSSQKIIAAPETIVIKRAVQSGAVLHSRTYTVQSIQSPNCSGNVSFTAEIMGDKSASILPGILRTNVKGIGAKVFLEMSTGRIIQWPSGFSAKVDELKGSKITIELIKVDDNIDTGVLPGHINLQIKSEQQSVPVVDIILPASYVNVLSRSCWANSDRVTNVNLPNVALRHFTQPGDVAGIKPFNINLVCNGDATSVPNIGIKWQGHAAKNNSSNGVLRNMDSNGAKGIGIQILNKLQQPVNFDVQENHIVLDQKEGQYSIPLFAQYYQFEQKITPGKINTFVHFNINYQ